jgi:hypothetical protein
MSRDNDIVGGEVETLITFVISRVSRGRHNEWIGGWVQFVDSLCGKVGIANTTENMQVLIRGCGTVKSDIRA